MKHACKRRLQLLCSVPAAFATLLVALESGAYACGASAGGEAGISGCSLTEHEEEERPKWRVGAAYTFTSTGLHFGDGLHVHETRNLALAAIDYSPTPRITLEAGAGAFLAGNMDDNGVNMSMSPGFVGALGASWRVLDAKDLAPFVLLSAQASYVSSSTPGSVSYNALDFRGGLAVGWTIWRAFAPYLVGRGFGGPVYWTDMGKSVIGTDDHHFQVGAGASLLIARRVDVFVEGVPLGEQAGSAGVGFLF